jgi:hypothetical protein
MGVAFRLPALRLVEIAADLPRRRYSCGEVQVSLVLNRLRHPRLPLLMPVHVRVDDARHDVLASGIDFRICAAQASACHPHVRNDPVLDDDVDGARRRPRVAVNDHRVLEDQPARRLGVERGHCGGLLRLAPERQPGEQQNGQQAGSKQRTAERQWHARSVLRKSVIIHLVKWQAYVSATVGVPQS